MSKEPFRRNGGADRYQSYEAGSERERRQSLDNNAFTIAFKAYNDSLGNNESNLILRSSVNLKQFKAQVASPIIPPRIIDTNRISKIIKTSNQRPDSSSLSVRAPIGK